MISTQDRIAQATNLINTPLFHELWDEMEQAAINGCIHAKPTDHETRAAFAAEARAIRNFRGKLNVIIDEAKAPRKGAPA